MTSYQGKSKLGVVFNCFKHFCCKCYRKQKKEWFCAFDLEL